MATYQHLRIAAGLSAKGNDACEAGLKNSMYSVMIQSEYEIIGMGRLVGDGGCFCQDVDIRVLPEFRGKAVGKMIMQHLTRFIHEQLPVSCYVSLIADGDASFLDKQFGFIDTMPRLKGMYLPR